MDGGQVADGTHDAGKCLCRTGKIQGVWFFNYGGYPEITCDIKPDKIS